MASNKIMGLSACCVQVGFSFPVTLLSASAQLTATFGGNMRASGFLERPSAGNIETWADALNVLDEMDSEWRWLNEEQLTTGAVTVRERIIGGIHQSRRSLQQLMNQGHGINAAINILNTREDLVQKGSLLHVLFSDARDALSVSGALFALGFEAGMVSLAEAKTPEELAGALWLVSPGFAAHEAFTEVLRRERTNLRSTVRQISVQSREGSAKADKEWQSVITEAKRVGRRWAATRSYKLRASSRHWAGRHAASEASIQAVDAAFREQMGLKAPVQYWKTKSADHRKAEQLARLWVLVFFPVALIGIGAAFYLTGVALLVEIRGSQAPGAAPFPNAIFLIASAGLASCAGLIFWVGRLLTKLYLSQHHLRQDAEERATMTETYLALIENSAASAEDRQIVLNALFRSTPDGIVKEEGGLDPSIAAALGKFLAKP